MPDANAKKADALQALLLCKSVEEAAKMSGVSKPWFSRHLLFTVHCIYSVLSPPSSG
jgi:hypothetical protein